MRATAIVFPMILLGALLVLAAPAAAKDEVTIDVISISASATAAGGEKADGEVFVDPRLSDYARKLRSLFAYKRYTFLTSGRIETAMGGSARFQLPERFSLVVEPQGYDESDERIEMMITLIHDIPPEPDEGGEPRSRSQDSGRGRGRESREHAAVEQEIILRTKIRLGNGGTVLLGGPTISSGTLILALSARR